MFPKSAILDKFQTLRTIEGELTIGAYQGQTQRNGMGDDDVVRRVMVLFVVIVFKDGTHITSDMTVIICRHKKKYVRIE